MCNLLLPQGIQIKFSESDKLVVLNNVLQTIKGEKLYQIICEKLSLYKD